MRLSRPRELAAAFRAQPWWHRNSLTPRGGCPKAPIRSHLWDPSHFRDPAELPSVGDIMQAITAGEFDGRAYDAAYPERIRQTIY